MLQRKRCKITGIGGTMKSTEVGDHADNKQQQPRRIRYYYGYSKFYY